MHVDDEKVVESGGVKIAVEEKTNGGESAKQGNNT